jgi:hypothetical protein
MVESMLRAAGYTTGLFTSPHLCDVRERVRVNGWVRGQLKGARARSPLRSKCCDCAGAAKGGAFGPATLGSPVNQAAQSDWPDHASWTLPPNLQAHGVQGDV